MGVEVRARARGRGEIPVACQRRGRNGEALSGPSACERGSVGEVLPSPPPYRSRLHRGRGSGRSGRRSSRCRQRARGFAARRCSRCGRRRRDRRYQSSLACPGGSAGPGGCDPGRCCCRRGPRRVWWIVIWVRVWGVPPGRAGRAPQASRHNITAGGALNVGAVEVKGSGGGIAGGLAAVAVGLGLGDELGWAGGSVEHALTAAASPAVPANWSNRRRLTSSGPVDGLVGRRLLHDGHDTEAHVDRGAKAAAIQFPQSHQFSRAPAPTLCKIRACPLLMVRYLLGTPSCACWARGEWARSISCSIHGCPVRRR